MKRFLFALALSLIACTPSDSPTTAPSPSEPTVETTTAASTSSTAAPTTTSTSGCQTDGMTEEVLDPLASPDSDAEQLNAITWETNPACERFMLEFTSAEGAPATTPPETSAEFLRDSAVLRVYLDVETTAVTDQLVQSALVDRLFVVRRPDRSLFIDFHLLVPATGAIAASESGNVLVYLEPGGADYEGVASFADNVVVVQPTPGEVEIPFMISGYSRNFEATTNVQVIRDGEVVLEEFATAADWVETWGEFELEVAPDGSGPAELFVGEFSAQDGSPRGLSIDIDF